VIQSVAMASCASFSVSEQPSPEEAAAHEENHARALKNLSGEREIVVRKKTAPAPKAERSGTKIAAVLEKAKTGITMEQVKEMTGWSKKGGFFGAVMRRADSDEDQAGQGHSLSRRRIMRK
jgi:hypothetical protein